MATDLTMPSTYWDNFNNRAVATGTVFSSVYNIDTIYQPVAFTNAVDLTDENAVKTFFETYGTSVSSITTETPLNVQDCCCPHSLTQGTGP